MFVGRRRDALEAAQLLTPYDHGWSYPEAICTTRSKLEVLRATVDIAIAISIDIQS